MNRPTPTSLEVSLDSLSHNFRAVSNHVGSAVVAAVVKSEAYGHGAVPVADHLSGLGCTCFAVATLDEGIQLREFGIRGEILMLGGQMESEYRLMAYFGLTPTLSSAAAIEGWAREAAQLGKRLDYHVEVDIGLGRLGFMPWESQAALEAAASNDEAIRLSGVMGHLSSPSTDSELSEIEHQRFKEFAQRIVSAFPGIARHVAASQASTLFPDMHHDLVRIGGLLYGLQHVTGTTLQPDPIMTFKTQVNTLRRLPSGWYLGYDKRRQLDEERLVATLPVGWTDGLNRAMVGRASFLVGGQRCPLIATYTDYSTVDVTDVPSVEVGQEVVIFGTQQGATVTAIELATSGQVSTGELLGKVSLRVPRHYLVSGERVSELSLHGLRST